MLCFVQMLQSWLEVLANNFLKIPIAYHSCTNRRIITPSLIFLEYNPCRVKMSIFIFPLVTSTVGATESLITIGLREVRETQRGEKFL